MLPGDPDRELLDRISVGDQKAIEEFVARFKPRLITFARKHGVPWPDYQDIGQVTVVAAINQIQSRAFRGDARLSSWLFAILNHKIQDYFRQHYRHAALISESSLPDGLPDHRVNQEMLFIIREILDDLPKIHRLVLEWRFVENRPSKEIAIELGLPEGTINRKVFEAKQMFIERYFRRKRDDSATKDKGSADE